MEDKTYNVDMSYPRVAALLRREYAGMDCMGQILEKCTSVTPIGVVYQFERVLKDLERNSRALEVNGKCLGTVGNVEFEVDKDRCEGFEEFLAMMREAAEKEKVILKYCPFDNTRGCIRGDVWIVKQIEHETCFETVETKINGRVCQAWSSELGRCLRIEPVLEHEHVEKTQRAKTYRDDGSKIPPQMV